MFDQYQEQLERDASDKWFYPTVIYSVATFVALTVFALSYSDVVSISDSVSGGMKVEGEVLVTREQKPFKLSSVKVCAVPEERMLAWVASKNERAAPERKKAKLALDYARYTNRKVELQYRAAGNEDEKSRVAALQTGKSAEFSKAESDYRYWFSPAFYLNGLKDCQAQTKTDADGKFSLTLRKGKHALAVEAPREATGLAEDYYWLIWVTPETAARPVVLGDENLMTANPPEKVIETGVF